MGYNAYAKAGDAYFADVLGHTTKGASPLRYPIEELFIPIYIESRRHFVIAVSTA